MNIIFQRAAIEQLDLLVQTRIEVLRAANLLSRDVDMSEVEATSREYYREALADGSHTAYLAFDDGAFVGAGGVSYYRVMPTYHNPTGRKAYIMNMYVRPACRRRGVAAAMVRFIRAWAKEQGFRRLELNMWEFNRGALAFYEAAGLKTFRRYMEVFLDDPAQED